MVQKWDMTGAYLKPAAGDSYDDVLGDLINGVDSAASSYYGSSDPSSGASWGAAQLGFLWIDSTNEIDGAGDDLGPVVKRWSMLTAVPTYGWRTLGLRTWVALEPNVNALDVSNQSTAAFADLDLTASTSALATAVLLQVEVQDSGPAGTAVYAEFRKNGTTTDARSRRVYPQVINIPIMQQIILEMDSGQVIEYAINASGVASMDVRADVLGYWERG